MSETPAPSRLDELLANARFARAIARALLHDEHAADDLVQTAYVAAMEHPPRGSVRAWLRTVLRNIASNVRRGAARRRDRERAAMRPEALPSAAESCARAETLRRVIEAVIALEEPYRSTVLLRFYHGLE